MPHSSNPLEDRLARLIADGEVTDLGHDHWLRTTQWAPDRDLNPRYAGIADINPWGAIIYHRRPNGILCSGHVTFDTPEHHKVFAISGPAVVWQVMQWEPLTIRPSVLCKFPLDDGGTCGDHGYITEGRWEPC